MKVSCYEEEMSEMSGTVVSSGALVKGNAADASAQGADSCAFLLEEYLDGPEGRLEVERLLSPE